MRTLTVEPFRNLLHQIRQESDKLAKWSKEDGVASPTVIADLQSIRAATWKIEEMVDRVMTEINK